MSFKTGLSIHMVVPGLPFTAETAETQALGGSETAAYYLAKELGKRGHNVSVYTTANEIMSEGNVAYLPIKDTWSAIAHGTVFDVCIAQRAPGILSTRLSSRLNVFWAHDEALKHSRPEFGSVLWNADKIAVISRAMFENYKQMHDIDDRFLWQTRNGIDPDTFAGVSRPYEDRMPYHFAYAARPERGLDYLLFEIMPRLIKMEPRVKLVIAGYQDLNDNPWASLYMRCRDQANKLGGNVVIAGQMGKRGLAEMYGRVGAYAYPTPSPIYPDFWETSCISAMEAQAAGLPLITTARGALTETIHKDAGILLDLKPGEHGHAEMFCNALLSVLGDKSRWTKMSQAGLEHAKTLTWASIAAEWETMIEAEIIKKSSNKYRLASHFYRHSDIMAAKKVIESDTSGETADLGKKIDRLYPQIESKEAYDKLYSRVYGDIEYNLSQINGDEGNGKQRFEELRKFVGSILDEARINEEPMPITRVLDYGCHTGIHAIRLAQAFPGLIIEGYDSSVGAIEMLNEMADRLGVRNVKGVSSPDQLGDGYDLVIASEILEHTVNPTQFAAELELYCRDGGYVYYNVPFGPWEYPSYPEEMQEHLYEFDHHDLADLFKAKKILKSDQIVASTRSPENLNEPIGWNVVAYQHDSKAAVGEINWDRKTKLQAPRETVSLVMIAGPTAHITLEWSLQSVVDIADEIIIGDTGMTEAGKKIAEQFGAKLVPAPSPLTSGFETPRNVALAHARMDWILWIDSDERIIDPYNLHRYLRNNMFAGYSIRQHHFAVDSNFPPDLPVRLFRNNGKIRWYGMIHEHPEAGLNKGPGRTALVSDVAIAHLGYLTESVRRKRFERNLPLLEADVKKYPDRILQKLFLMRDNVLMATRVMERNGGVVDRAVHHHCMETINIWRQYFRAKSTMSSSDPLEYYSQACEILKMGFIAEIRISINDQAQGTGNIKSRWANHEDYMIEMQHRLASSYEMVT